ncbi:pyruvate dehydrogenase complex dihydrolipoamide acetyltransferase [Afifella marina]|uniref:Acetyltransferase component of pyruvate dehydrogenase complex n=1 Tax=Afifella marina DSM 2698 TaxID=1120955 RepID=A0A1G5NJA4_AFIMA|nr:pyruvate dehydrogenase complex dihydrolipoamide acetyltransferase [Afifella marina]MBK1623638.1 pyruvate dehydrogenase complex dihydrolipoamide acetyltransferase [Afifella marina DSM 2698]MBK1626631.1 pyruvate dehydrogenase complex dihydrolipoamide acetyltransferase [Afifella marina]MBK5916180.1 pyruvate dehydrogenase complex dihydrolipoamide acetyltransferase [Afifella marina]RAI21623.1 pyruvate dehydrogenase complex dihydrolipoamide acetyltransferase [Afifella marina DSM 2698]SCZ37477.1 p
MSINILMPALSPTMEKGNLAKWHVKEGDAVAPGDVIAEIETDKATMEVEAIDEGTVAKILVSEGTEDVAVNDVIAILAEEGEDADAVEAPAEETAAPQNGKGADAAPPEPKETEGGEAVPREGLHEAGAADKSKPSREKEKSNGKSSGRIFASPLAKRLAKEKGLDLSALSGSGPHGRIVKHDIEEAVEKGEGKAAAPAAAEAAPASAPKTPAPAGMSDEQIRKMFDEGSYEVVPHDSMRRTIARRLVEAKTTIPHFYLTSDCEIDALLKLRSEINAAAPVIDDKPAYKLSVNDFVIKAMAMALQAVPEANVTWTQEAMLKHEGSDVGVAVSIPGGLITPVIRDAEKKTLSVISNEMKDMAGRARQRKLKPEEYQGGTTAVSNLGMYGIRDFAAVINPPHATILAVGAGEKRAVVRDDRVTVASIMTVTLSTDHRAVDGALGAEMLAAFKRYIENPMTLLI